MQNRKKQIELLCLYPSIALPYHLKKQRIVHGKRGIFLDGGPSSIEKKGHPLSLNFCSGLVNLVSTGLELNCRGAHSRCEIAKASLLPAHSLLCLHWKVVETKELFCPGHFPVAHIYRWRSGSSPSGFCFTALPHSQPFFLVVTAFCKNICYSFCIIATGLSVKS